MAKNLFILSTPSQAFFLNQTPELIHDATLVLTVQNKNMSSDILRLLEEHSWQSIHIIHAPRKNDYLKAVKMCFFRIWLWYFTFNYSQFDTVYIGSYSNFFQLSILAEYEKSARIFLLYDGTQMIAVARNRMNSEHEIRQFPRFFKLMKFKQPRIERLNFIGPLELQVNSQDQCVKINNTKRFPHPMADDRKAFFVGQPLVELEIVTENFYFEWIKTLKEIFPGKHFFYVPHPRENPTQVSKIGELMEIKKFDGIFEEQFLKSTIFPNTIVSFYSSVLLNLSFLNSQLKIYSINIPSSEFLRKGIYDNVQQTYKFMEKTNYPKIENLSHGGKKNIFDHQKKSKC